MPLFDVCDHNQEMELLYERAVVELRNACMYREVSRNYYPTFVVSIDLARSMVAWLTSEIQHRRVYKLMRHRPVVICGIPIVQANPVRA